jgi:proteasome lid subunit RPN8/RPN11
MITRIILPNHLRDQMIAHARENPDAECCGLLVGRGEGDLTVVKIHRARNIADDTSKRFEIDPQEQFNLLRQTRGTDLRVIGHYHSHPHALAQPSGYDVEMAHDPEAVWCIIGLKPDVLYAFVCADQTQGFKAIPITVAD